MILNMGNNYSHIVRSNNNLFVASLLIATTLLLSEVVAAKVLFQTVKENVVIDGIKPFFNQDVGNTLKCYAICQRKADRCLYVEVSNLRENKWSCKLFEFVGDIKNHLKAAVSGTTTVATPTLKRDCLDLLHNGFKTNGVYYIGFSGSPQKVFCDMTTEGGGWIVMQKRFDGSVDFYRDWESYTNGFGDVYGEYWLGNDFVHQYTNAHPTEMISEAIAFDGSRAATKLQNFQVGDEELSKYTLQFGSCIVLTDTSDTICEDWDFQKHVKFSTFDMDNDRLSGSNCVEHFNGGAWWNSNCFQVNFNGYYSSVQTVPSASKIHWYNFRGYVESLKETRMLIKRIQ